MDRRGLIWAGILLLVFAAAIGWILWDQGTNYAPVRATVVAIGEECTLERTTFDQNDYPRTERKGPMACPEAERLKREVAPYWEFAIARQRLVNVRFVSPADGRVHVGSLRPREGYLADAAPGSAIDIVAHKSKPEEVGLRN